ncbi:unnamed protein product [Prorocentrum cordatum]|uniref:RING-type domain-containing protein n=1 Tax=Prorocentrum cordatum TaxID=2364126 RepID=A0ABN9PYM0_9DINO|nr:unnamed protein product [Polarella glacialis]
MLRRCSSRVRRAGRIVHGIACGEVSRARQMKKCKQLGKDPRPRTPRSRSRSASSSGSAGSAACVLRAASDSEEDAMAEAAGLVGASDANAMAATGEAGLALAPLPASSAPQPNSPCPAVVGGAREESAATDVQVLLQQLSVEPADAKECAAKFLLYEGYGEEVEGMRSTLLHFYEENKPTLPPAIVTDMDHLVRGIDSEDAMRIPDETREWFVYHMMRQAVQNNLKMASILDGMAKKLKFLAANHQVECPVCLEAFGEGVKGPETLGCCHKVCKDCWHHWAKVMRGQPFCPLCRHEKFLGTVAAQASAEPNSGQSSDGEGADADGE